MRIRNLVLALRSILFWTPIRFPFKLALQRIGRHLFELALQSLRQLTFKLSLRSPFRIAPPFPLQIAFLLALHPLLVSSVSAESSRESSTKSAFSFTSEGFTTSKSQVALIQKYFSELSSQFPVLTARVIANGYSRVVFRKKPSRNIPQRALARLEKDPKRILIYERLLKTSDDPILKELPYSLIKVTLLHELLHGFDKSSKLVVHNLPILGWDLKNENSPNGYQISSLPWIENIWISNTKALAIEKSALQSKARAWQAHFRANQRVQEFGYPTIYSVTGGPAESFAELGAYIALDPKAEFYVPVQTVRWFREHVLR